MPTQVTYMHVRVGTVVIVGNDLYYPNADYWVDPDYYNTSKTADGRDFKDACISAVSETQTFGV
jgi:hypothetical protein